jgi:hypothetical protein
MPFIPGKLDHAIDNRPNNSQNVFMVANVINFSTPPLAAKQMLK